MSQIRAALVQVNVSVGALLANAHKIARLAREAAERGAQVVIFPELVLSGYPPEDLVLKAHFMADCKAALRLMAKELPKQAIVIVGTPLPENGGAFNAAAVFARGRLVGFYRKMLLPNYGVFDEKRVFRPGEQSAVIDFNGMRIGLHICEDSWSTEATPCKALKAARVDAVVNISASPYHRGKLKQRESMMRKAARFIGAPLLYCNLVGGQDELVFDGASMAFDARGKLLARARQFGEETLFVDFPIIGKKSGRISNRWKIQTLKTPLPLARLGESGGHNPRTKNGVVASALPKGSGSVQPALDDLAEVYAALKMGLKDYVDKNGFSKVVIGISGGIDSALVATIAVDALGQDRVVGVTMPSRFSSSETLSDALKVGQNLGIRMMTVPIKKYHDAYLQDLARLWPDRAEDTTEENLQARIRGNIIMALSNKFGWLVVTTGNKSEMAAGYCTLYGDMAGGFALIKDVPKMLVFALSRWRNGSTSLTAGVQTDHEVIPVSTIERPPSAELKPDQRDQDTLPPYEVLDAIIERYVEQDQSADQIVAGGFERAVVKKIIRMIDRNEYKRRQGAPGVKITPKAFGRDRRMPITNLYGERV